MNPAEPTVAACAWEPGAWSAFDALVNRLPEANQDRAGDLVMSAEDPDHAVALLYERYGQMLGVAQRLEIERLIEELPAERRSPWRTCVADWAAQGINPETVITAVGLELTPAGAPASTASVAPTTVTHASNVATVAPVTIPKPALVAPVETVSTTVATAPGTAATEADLGLDDDGGDDRVELSDALAYGGVFGLIGRCCNLGLTPCQLTLFMYFIGCRNRATGQAWQGMHRAAKHTQMAKSTAVEARDDLVAIGLLDPAGKRTQGRAKGQESNSYRVHLPSRATLKLWQGRVAAARTVARKHRKGTGRP